MTKQRRAQRFMLIGMDGAGMENVLHMVQRGHMPNVARLLHRGVHRGMWGVLPTLTPPGWTTLVTGAWPSTHGVMDFNIRKPQAPLDETEWGINTRLCRAEYLWNTVERGGKTPLLVKYEMSWPPTITRGVQVEGTGPGISNHAQIAGYHLFTVGRQQQERASADTAEVDPSALRERLRYDPVTLVGVNGAGWSNLPASAREPKFATLHVLPLHRSHAFMRRAGSGEPKEYYALIYAQTDAGYDRVRITRGRDGADRLFTEDLAPGGWSGFVRDRFRIGAEEVEGHVRAKLIELSPQADRMELFFPQIWPVSGYTQPEEVAEEILQHVGPFLQNPGRDALGVIDDDTYFELLDYHLETLAKVAIHLCATRRDWGALFTQTHAPDYANHFFIADADPISGAAPAVVERSFRGMTRTYEACDRWIGRLADALLDDETVLSIVSDHGGTSTTYPLTNAADVLEQAGLLAYKQDGAAAAGGRRRAGRAIDWTKTKAAPVGVVNIYVNLKGREPTGIVDPADYEQVRREIIHALYGYRDPKAGYCPFTLALRREDAEAVNMWGELVGDVVYATLPEFDGAHGHQLPSARWGWGGQHACFIMAGAGVRRGVHLGRQVRQVDVAPTLAYAAGLPLPRDNEGRVLYEALEEPPGINP